MTQVVYVDVLVGVNWIINYFLLLASAKFLALPQKRGRLVASAGLGAFYSLSILLPAWNPYLSFLVKLCMSATMVLAAFGWRGAKAFLRATAAFYIVNFAFAGLMLALWYFIAPQGMMIRNNVVYFDISPLLLIVLTVACYILITLIHKVTGRQMPKELFCRLTLLNGGRACEFTGKVDTGNSLREPFSGDPVAVVYEPAIASVIPEKGSLNFRLIPFEEVSGGGVLEAFKPDKLIIRSGQRSVETKQVYIAVAKTKFGEFDALVSPDLLQKLSG